MVRAVILLLLFAAPASAQLPNYSDLVRQAYDSFGPGELEGCGEGLGERLKAKLTFRAAYLIHQQDPTIGLFRKEQGNNVDGKSVDIVHHKHTGAFADVATDRITAPNCFSAQPVWVPNGPDANTRDLSRWVEPQRAWAGFDPIVAQPHTPEPEPQQPNSGAIPPALGTDYAALMQRLDEMEKRLQERIDRPGWLTRFLGNRAVQIIGASAGAGIVALLQGEPRK